jgi:dehydrogenase/reductase SDR family member 7B
MRQKTAWLRECYGGKVVWITGSSAGIGRALALAFARVGAKLILSSRDAQALAEVREACAPNADARVLPLDLAALDTLSGAAEQALGLWGHVDYMVHNAGIALRAGVEETPLDLDQQIMATNYFGPVVLTKALLPSMLHRESGCFVVVTSLSGKYGAPRLSAYAASKHALHGYFDSLRAELHARHIQVTIVVPGFIRTDILRHALVRSGSRYGKSLPEYERGMDPERCATHVLRAVAQRREEVLIGGSEMLTVYLNRFFPTLLSRLIRSHPARLRNRLLRLLSFGLLSPD